MLPKVKAPFERTPEERVNWKASIPFLLVHVLAVAGTLWFGITPKALVLFVVVVWGRMFFITGGYHRYFAHRTYRTSRAFQLVLAVGGASSAQKGPLWWAGHHRNHHRYSDTELDIHSPLRGFWWSHVGWILCDRYDEIPHERIRDFAKYPEIRFVEKWNGLFPWLLGHRLHAHRRMVGPVLQLHARHGRAVALHVPGQQPRPRHGSPPVRHRRHESQQLVHLGAHPRGGLAQQPPPLPGRRRGNGFFWWELDVTWYILKGLSWIGVVKDLKVPSKEILDADRIANGNFDVGMFKYHWARAQAEVARSRVDDRIEVMASGSLDPSVVGRRDALELALETEKVATDRDLHDAVADADVLARVTRRSQREFPQDV